MTMRIFRRHRAAASMVKKERGQSLVELALSLPILILLMAGIVDVGFVLYAHVQVAAASGEGARAASHFVADPDKNQAQNDADRRAMVVAAVQKSRGMLNLSSLSVPQPSSPASYYPNPVDPLAVARDVRSGWEVVVEVGYSQPIIFGWVPGFPGGSISVSGSTRGRLPK